MAKKKQRGPKPSGSGSRSGPAPSAKPRPPKYSTRRRGPSPVVWIVIAVVAVAAVVGIVIQSSRSETENASVVTPKHELGPNQTEIEGDASAPVLVEEYGDYQCPACEAFFRSTDPTIKQLVADGKIRFAFGNFAFLGPESYRAASAAICAADAGKFWEYHDLLYSNQAAENSGFLTHDRLVAFGEEAGITGADLDTFEECVRSDRYEGFVRRQTDNTSKNKSVTQTPTVFVNGVRLEQLTPAGLTAAVNAAS
jgi:protein-disulfide isomerase